MPEPDPPEVLIFEKNGRYHVEPGTVRCKAGVGKIRFRNFTGKTARVWMPVLRKMVDVDDLADFAELVIEPGQIPPGVYEYAVSLEAVERPEEGKKGKGGSWLAEGNSAPRMVYD